MTACCHEHDRRVVCYGHIRILGLLLASCYCMLLTVLRGLFTAFHTQLALYDFLVSLIPCTHLESQKCVLERVLMLAGIWKEVFW